MKNPYVKIVKVESTEDYVRIMVLAKGTEKPYFVDINPHNTYIHLNVGGIGNRDLLPVQMASNLAEIHFVERKDRKAKLAEFKERGQIPG